MDQKSDTFGLPCFLFVSLLMVPGPYGLEWDVNVKSLSLSRGEGRQGGAVSREKWCVCVCVCART
jgi:hypothetical protein